ncbi:MAG: helix-turn-helix domain-containing protein [Actinobacteria bacterium]|nr:helix-turn-helix domain-containing protein [Actinomycetota bacterium]
MAPAESLARLRKGVLDRVARGGVTVRKACTEAGISPARYYQLRARYLAYGEAGMRRLERSVDARRTLLNAPRRQYARILAVRHDTA